MAQLGTQNGTAPDVKQFAQQMETDHQQMDQQLTQYGQESGAQLEGKTYTKELDRAKKDLQGLQKKSGADFDKAFMSKMVKDHEKDLKTVKEAAKDAHKKNDNQLASVLDQAQTTIQGHLDHAKQVQASVKSEKPGRQAAGQGAASGTSGTGSTQQQPSQMPQGEQLKGRGDTGGATPQSSTPGEGTSSPTTPSGGEKGTSSDSGASGTK
jgi:predicted outer membrane protein